MRTAVARQLRGAFVKYIVYNPLRSIREEVSKGRIIYSIDQ